jgi:hypothetical protein
MSTLFTSAALQAFDAVYDTASEDLALHTRGAFLEAFPISRLRHLTLESYVIGLQSPTFCDYVEVKTRSWAIIQGATAFKFGIYFGRTKSDRTQKYRFTGKFGTTKEEAFAAVKQALLDLVQEGTENTPDFSALDENPLSQMFKAKILSLYFPEGFLNVCSSEHLQLFGAETGLPENLFLSEYQHRLVQAKRANPLTRAWSNPKFMRFLYQTYIPKHHQVLHPVRKPRAISHPKVNFEDMEAQRKIIGKKAEEFAFAWEKQRLIGAGCERLIDAIDDRRDRPGFGYDFLSHNAAGQQRFIEVKAVAKVREGHRFFLSDNEYVISRSQEHKDGYVFYLVMFEAGEPSRVFPIPATELYRDAKIEASSYTVRFQIEHSANYA